MAHPLEEAIMGIRTMLEVAQLLAIFSGREKTNKIGPPQLYPFTVRASPQTKRVVAKTARIRWPDF
jgi:hypothetical protein